MITTVTLNASIDKAYYMEQAICNGEVMRVSRCRNSAGGKGLNVARVIQLCEEDVLATGIVGGYNGQYLESLLVQDNIAYDFAHVAGETRSCINILDPKYGSTEYLEPGCLVTSEEEQVFMDKFIVILLLFLEVFPKGYQMMFTKKWLKWLKQLAKKLFLILVVFICNLGYKLNQQW